VKHESEMIKMVVDEDQPIPAENPKIQFNPDQTRIYCDEWLVGGSHDE
jgi:hypothetical protein